MGTHEHDADRPERQVTRTPAEIGPEHDDASLGDVREGALEPDPGRTRPRDRPDEPDARSPHVDDDA